MGTTKSTPSKTARRTIRFAMLEGLEKKKKEVDQDSIRGETRIFRRPEERRNAGGKGWLLKGGLWGSPKRRFRIDDCAVVGENRRTGNRNPRILKRRKKKKDPLRD